MLTALKVMMLSDLKTDTVCLSEAWYLPTILHGVTTQKNNIVDNDFYELGI
jgi:hypothetical protein